MKTARGMGNVYRPTYRDGKTCVCSHRKSEHAETCLIAGCGCQRFLGAMRTCSTWWIVYHVNGRRIAENAHTKNRAAAVRLLKKRTGDAATGKPVGPELGRTTLDDLIAMVEADYMANDQSSVDRVLQAAVHLRAFFRAERKACDITTDTLTRYQAYRLAEKAAPSSVNCELSILRRGFRLAARAGKVGGRPEFVMLKVNNARKGFFEREQYDVVRRHLPDDLKPVMNVTYITGWRTISELLTRQWRHVDFDAGWLRLDPGETKNGEGRMFPLTPELRAVLESQRERVREIERATGTIIPWVFPHFARAGGRVKAGSRIKDYRGAWNKARTDAGIPGHLVHDFRRTAVRNLERSGISRSAAMKMTGHKTDSVYQRYAIVDEGMLQEAAIKLGAFHAAEAAAQKEKRKSIAKVSASDARPDGRPLQIARDFT